MIRLLRRSSGFTLLELCIVMVLVAVLAFFLNGAMSRVQTANRKALDLVHLHQVGVALIAYTTDHQQILPPMVSPSPLKTLAVYLGYLPTTGDWSNDASTPKNSIFKPAANQNAIRKLFISGYDERPQPDPLNSFCTNSYIGKNPGEVLEPGKSSENVERLNEVLNPSRKIYMVPSRFRVANPPYSERFSASASATFFRTGSSGEGAERLPALFMDGHTEMFDPYLKGITLNAANDCWIRPQKE